MIGVHRESPLRRQSGSLVWLIGGLSLVAAAGCQRDEQITRTTEPRSDTVIRPAAKDANSTEKVPTRLLGAIAPAAEGQSWFFKLMGPKNAIGAQEKAFDEFLASVQFSDDKDKPVAWTLPAGWRKGPKKFARHATLLPDPNDDKVELAISSAGGSLAENVNRWRGQLSLEPLAPNTAAALCREITTRQGKKLFRVDLTGMAAPGPAMPPFMQMHGGK